MSSQKCNLIFSGRFVDEMDLDTIHESLAGIFKTDIDKIRSKFSDKPTIIKANADKEVCIKMQKVILSAGAYCDIEDIVKEAPPLVEEAAPVSPAPEAAPNPYAVPQSDIRTEKSNSSSSFTGPNAVPVSHGIRWFTGGLSLFFKSPLMWILAMLLYCIMNIIQIVPLIGGLIMIFINPILIGGFYHGANDLHEDGIKPSPGCIFRGFSQNGGQLALLGLSILGFTLVMIAAFAVIFMAAFGLNFSDFGNPAAFNTPPNGTMIFVLVVAVFLLMIPGMMVYWFSIPLITFNDKNVFEAFAISFKACLKNIIPFIIYILVIFGFYILFSLGFGLIIGVTGFLAGNNSSALAFLPVIIMIPFILCIMPIILLSMFATYKDVFYND